MPTLFGKPADRATLAARAGSFAQFGGVRLVTGADGVERGLRMLEIPHRNGLAFTVLGRPRDGHRRSVARRPPDRLALPHRLPPPSLHEPKAKTASAGSAPSRASLPRAASTTSSAPEEVDAESYNYPRRAT